MLLVLDTNIIYIIVVEITTRLRERFAKNVKSDKKRIKEELNIKLIYSDYNHVI